MGRADNDDVLDRRRRFVADAERALRGPAASDEIENSAADEVIAKVSGATEKDVGRAVRTVSDTPVEWSQMQPRERGGPRALADALHYHTDGFLVLDELGPGNLRSAVRNGVACGAAARPGGDTRKNIGRMNHPWSRGLSYGLTSRVLLHESVADEGMEPVIDRVETLSQGKPVDPAAETGAFSSWAQCDKRTWHIGTVHRVGATLLADGGGRTAIGREVLERLPVSADRVRLRHTGHGIGTQRAAGVAGGSLKASSSAYASPFHGVQPGQGLPARQHQRSLTLRVRRSLYRLVPRGSGFRGSRFYVQPTWGGGRRCTRADAALDHAPARTKPASVGIVQNRLEGLPGVLATPRTR